MQTNRYTGLRHEEMGYFLFIMGGGRKERMHSALVPSIWQSSDWEQKRTQLYSLKHTRSWVVTISELSLDINAVPNPSGLIRACSFIKNQLTQPGIIFIYETMNF